MKRSSIALLAFMAVLLVACGSDKKTTATPANSDAGSSAPPTTAPYKVTVDPRTSRTARRSRTSTSVDPGKDRRLRRDSRRVAQHTERS